MMTCREQWMIGTGGERVKEMGSQRNLMMMTVNFLMVMILYFILIDNN